jgi:hypothetical protein
MKCSQFKIKWTPEQLKRGVVSPESNGRQKEIRVLLRTCSNKTKFSGYTWTGKSLMHVDRNTAYFHSERNKSVEEIAT